MDLEVQEEKVNEVTKCHDGCAEQVEMLTKIAIKQDQELTQMKRNVEQIRNEKNRNNLIIFGLEIQEDESLKTAVDNFFKLKMEITKEIAYQSITKRGSAHCVTLKNIGDKSHIYKHGKNLKNKVNSEGKSYQVRDDLTPAQFEEDKRLRQMVKRNTASNITMSLKRGQLTINNTKYQQKVPAPTVTDMLELSDEERETIQAKSLVSIQGYRERDNVYYAYAAKANSFQQVRSLYKHVKMKHFDATHCIMAHNIAGEMPDLKDYDDNGEYGGGSRILNILLQGEHVDTVVYIVCYHSGQNLGVRRFEIIKELTDKILDLIEKEDQYQTSTIKLETFKCKQVKRRTRGRVTGVRGGGHFLQPRYQNQNTDVKKGIYHTSRIPSPPSQVPIPTHCTYASILSNNRETGATADTSDSESEIVLGRQTLHRTSHKVSTPKPQEPRIEQTAKKYT